MARGGGLSLDSDPLRCSLPHRPVVLNSLGEERDADWGFMDATFDRSNRKGGSSGSGSGSESSLSSSSRAAGRFRVNLNQAQDDPSSLVETRTTVDEVDFFAEKRSKEEEEEEEGEEGGGKLASTSVYAAENGGMAPAAWELKVDTGLNLLTTNAGSDESMVDDEDSPHSEDKRSKTELVVLQAELERMKSENQRLKDMFRQVSDHYSSLRRHLATVMQMQESKGDRDAAECEELDGGGAQKKVVDLCLASNADNAKEPSLSSSDGRSQDQSRSPAINDDDGKGLGWGPRRDEVRDQGRNPSKVARVSPENEDQTEATMKKARVSVRARSEAPMV